MKYLIFSILVLFSFVFSTVTQSKTDSTIVKKIEILIDSAKIKLGTNQNKVLENANGALQLSKKHSLKKQEALSHNLFGYYYLYESNYAEALKSFQFSLNIYQTLKDSAGILNAHYTLGQTRYYQGFYPQAMKHYNIAFALAKSLKDKTQECNVKFEIGYVYYSQSNLKSALQSFLDALKIAEFIKDNSSIKNSLLNALGNIYFEFSEYPKALEYYQLSLELNKKIKNIQGEAYSINNIGNVYLKQKKPQLALEEYNKAKKLFESIHYEQGEAITLSNTGMAYEDNGEIYKAIRCYEDAIKINRKIGDLSGVSKTLGIIADLLIQEGEYDHAITNLNKSNEISKMISLTSQTKDNYKSLSQVYKLKGDLAKALENFEKFFILHDSIYNDETQQQFTELQTRFETEKKEKAIELLNKEKKIREAEFKQQSLIVSRQKTIILTIILIFIIVLVFSIIVYRQYRQKKLANETLYLQKEEIQAQRDQIEHDRDEIANINKDVLASIHYAKRIQQALLGNRDEIKTWFAPHFIIYLPKDIVSGDFYWIKKRIEWDGSITTLIVCADCTGHGVPGAFMSIISMNLLEKAFFSEKMENPAKILNFVTQNIHSMIRHSDNHSSLKDGMDIALCIYNSAQNQLHFAGARNSLLYINNGILNEIKGDKHFIGDALNSKFSTYNSHVINLEKNNIFYMYTDGYVDQFGSSNDKKFSSSRFRKIIVENSHKNISEQGELLLQEHIIWKSNYPQIDDILVMGFILNIEYESQIKI